MERLSRDEVLALPATLLLDPETGRAAAYNSSHRSVTDDASAALVTYARRKALRDEAYDPARRDPRGIWLPLPAWATPEIQSRLRLIWFRGSPETDAERRAIPLR